MGSEDEVLMEKARAEGRVIITCDKDFGRLVEFDDKSPPIGVILLRYELIEPSKALADLKRIIRFIEREKLLSTRFTIVVGEDQIRIRRRP